MPDSRLVLPYDVEGALVKVLGDRHEEHLAKIERLRGVQPRTFERFATVVRMADSGAVRLSGDTVPACLLGIIGAPVFRRNEDDAFDATYQLGMQVTVMGKNRRDVLLRRDVMAWTTVECLIQRTPRGSDKLIHAVRLMDYEPLSEGDDQRTLGDARMIFEVEAKNVMAVMGLPADGREWPAETGGAPAEPYDPVGPLPTADPVTVQFDRRPIVE